MRLFVAIKTSRAVNAAVKNSAASLALFGSGSFCGDELYHITLAFIGESERARDVVDALKNIKASPFDICTGELDAFADTYYVSIKESGQLNALQKAVVQALSSIGIKTEARQFKPHITVTRRFKAQMKPLVFVPAAEMTVNEIVLMESKNGKYNVVFTKPLNG